MVFSSDHACLVLEVIQTRRVHINIHMSAKCRWDIRVRGHSVAALYFEQWVAARVGEHFNHCACDPDCSVHVGQASSFGRESEEFSVASHQWDKTEIRSWAFVEHLHGSLSSQCWSAPGLVDQVVWTRLLHSEHGRSSQRLVFVQPAARDSCSSRGAWRRVRRDSSSIWLKLYLQASENDLDKNHIVLINCFLIQLKAWLTKSVFSLKNSRSDLASVSAPVLEFKKEVALFKSLIENTRTLRNSTFWRENMNRLPCLYRLNLQLFNIPASSAHLERFFSVTGWINNQRLQNMSDKLLVMRTMIKVNIGLLDNIKT